MDALTAAASDQGVTAIAVLTGLPSVRFSLDGVPLTAAFEVNTLEHERRQLLGGRREVCSASSWTLVVASRNLGFGGSAPCEEGRIAPPLAARRAGDADGFDRLYEPAGVVRAVGFAGRNPAALVDNAIRFTPIVQRFVLLTDPLSRVSSRSLAAACEWGVGIARVDDGQVTELLTPTAAVVGRPAVYRWWIAELAYQSWLQSNAQLVN